MLEVRFPLLRLDLRSLSVLRGCLPHRRTKTGLFDWFVELHPCLRLPTSFCCGGSVESVLLDTVENAWTAWISMSILHEMDQADKVTCILYLAVIA